MCLEVARLRACVVTLAEKGIPPPVKRGLLRRGEPEHSARNVVHFHALQVENITLSRVQDAIRLLLALLRQLTCMRFPAHPAHLPGRAHGRKIKVKQICAQRLGVGILETMKPGQLVDVRIDCMCDNRLEPLRVESFFPAQATRWSCRGAVSLPAFLNSAQRSGSV